MTSTGTQRSSASQNTSIHSSTSSRSVTLYCALIAAVLLICDLRIGALLVAEGEALVLLLVLLLLLLLLLLEGDFLLVGEVDEKLLFCGIVGVWKSSSSSSIEMISFSSSSSSSSSSDSGSKSSSSGSSSLSESTMTMLAFETGVLFLGLVLRRLDGGGSSTFSAFFFGVKDRVLLTTTSSPLFGSFSFFSSSSSFSSFLTAFPLLERVGVVSFVSACFAGDFLVFSVLLEVSFVSSFCW